MDLISHVLQLNYTRLKRIEVKKKQKNYICSLLNMRIRIDNRWYNLQ